MKLLIQDKPAALLSGQEVQLVLKNTQFSEQEAFSTELTLPIRDCAQNQAIFGTQQLIDDADAVHYDDSMEAKFYLDDDNYYEGYVYPMEINEENIVVQFVAGKNTKKEVENPFDKIYINEQTVMRGEMHSEIASYDDMSYCKAKGWDDLTDWQGNSYNIAELTKVHIFFTPWVNSNTGTVNNNDLPAIIPNARMPRLSGSFYLMTMVRALMHLQGYTCHFAQWASTEKALLRCYNTLPEVWGLNENRARVLPHWTYQELLDQLALLLDGTFSVDHYNKTVTFNSYQNITTNYMNNIVELSLNDVVDHWTKELSAEQHATPIPLKQVKYADRNDRMWVYQTAGKVINYLKTVYDVKTVETVIPATGETVISASMTQPQLKTFSSLELLYRYCAPYLRSSTPRGTQTDRESPFAQLFYVEDIKRYFCLRGVFQQVETDEEGEEHTVYYNTIQLLSDINGDIDEDGKNIQTLNIVPVCIDDVVITDEETHKIKQAFQAPFLPVPDYTANAEYFNEKKALTDEEVGMPFVPFLLQHQESTETTEFFDKLYVAYYFDELEEPEWQLVRPLATPSADAQHQSLYLINETDQQDAPMLMNYKEPTFGIRRLVAPITDTVNFANSYAAMHEITDEAFTFQLNTHSGKELLQHTNLNNKITMQFIL